jgi:hypothetical protein
MLMLFALGGAGLAVAVGRVPSLTYRPATQIADHAAQVWVTRLSADLAGFTAPVTGVATAGRDTLGNLQGMNFEAMRAAIDAGNPDADAISAGLTALASDQAAANANVDRAQLGAETIAELNAIDMASASLIGATTSWGNLTVGASNVAGLVGDLQHHDDLVFQATTAGRQGNWADALNALRNAESALNDAGMARSNLGPAATVDTLDQLVTRYRTYDAALTSLYLYLGDGGAQSGDTFGTLNKAVADGQATLPTNNAVFSVIVAELAGSDLTAAVADLEKTRSDIDAVAANGTAAP